MVKTISKKSEIPEKRLRELRNEGLTYREIADEVGISKSSVYTRFEEFEIPQQMRLKQSEVDPLDEIDAAYIAGIIDGEGSIGLWKHEQTRNSHKRITIRPSVRISMTDKDTIDFISEKLGIGSTSYRHPELENREKQYVFAVQAQNEVRDVLVQVRPYLTAKGDQADLVIDYCENREPHKPYTDEEIEMVDKLKDMKNGKTFN